MSPRMQIEAIIGQLNQVRSRKQMFMWPVDGHTCIHFVQGMSTTAYALGLRVDRNEAWRRAQVARGWRRSSFGPLPQMKKKGMSDEEMAEEVLLIEMDTWQLLLNDLPA